MAKTAITLIAIVLWALWIIHLAMDHTITVWEQVVVLAVGLVIPALVVARDWRGM